MFVESIKTAVHDTVAPLETLDQARVQHEFQTGFAAHQQHALEQASAAYARTLALDPKHSDALHLMGVVACQRADHALAADLIGQAIALQPRRADYHYNLGIALQALGHYGGAIASYDQAIALRPDYANAYANRGNALHEIGQFEAAVASHTQALALDPLDAASHSNRGNALQGLQHHEAALACYDQALALAPEFVDAHLNRGNALKALGQYAPALTSYERAIALAPARAEAYHLRGKAFAASQQYDRALASYDQALALQPGHAQTHFSRGVVLEALKLPQAALVAYDQAIACQPSLAVAHNNRGVLLREQHSYRDAIESYSLAIAADPLLDGAYYNRANAFKDLKQWDAAIVDYEQSTRINPVNASAHLNRGNLYFQLGDNTAAMASYDLALTADPAYIPARFNKAIPLLLTGQFLAGWAHYESRFKNPELKIVSKHDQYPAWRGQEPVHGKTVLLHCEQGFGDTLQFGRYAQAVAALGARVVLEVQAPLLGVFQHLPGVSHLMAEGVDPAEVGESIDFQCPLLSLPLVFQTEQDTIPTGIPYLRSNPAKVRAWQARLGPARRPRVGLAWSGSISHVEDRKRSIPLAQLLAHLPDGLDYVSLQKEVRPADLAALQASTTIQSFADELHDFDDTAALVECLDWVVSVDTSVAHLAGALGKPVWVLLPFVPDWRWLLDRDTSPWYPQAVLYRQSALDDWDTVLARLGGDLRLRAPSPES